MSKQVTVQSVLFVEGRIIRTSVKGSGSVVWSRGLDASGQCWRGVEHPDRRDRADMGHHPASAAYFHAVHRDGLGPLGGERLLQLPDPRSNMRYPPLDYAGLTYAIT